MSSRVRTVSNCANPCPVSFILRAMTCRAFQVLFTVTNCCSIESTSFVKQFVCCLLFRLQVFSSFSLPVSKLQFKSARNEWVPLQQLLLHLVHLWHLFSPHEFSFGSVSCISDKTHLLIIPWWTLWIFFYLSGPQKFLGHKCVLKNIKFISLYILRYIFMFNDPEVSLCTWCEVRPLFSLRRFFWVLLCLNRPFPSPSPNCKPTWIVC